MKKGPLPILRTSDLTGSELKDNLLILIPDASFFVVDSLKLRSS